MATLLETPRLRLREMAESDLPFLTGLLGDPDVMAHFPAPLAPDEARGWYDRTRACYARAGHGFWLAERRDTGEPVGQAGLLPKDIDGMPEVEVAYMLHPAYWGRGLATEAALACRERAFRILGASRVVSLIRPANHPSLRVAARLGMRRVGETVHLGLAHDLYEARPR